MREFDFYLNIKIIWTLFQVYPQKVHVDELAMALELLPEHLWVNIHYLIELGRIGGHCYEECTLPGITQTPIEVWATAQGIEWLHAQGEADGVDA